MDRIILIGSQPDSKSRAIQQMQFFCQYIMESVDIFYRILAQTVYRRLDKMSNILRFPIKAGNDFPKNRFVHLCLFNH